MALETSPPSLIPILGADTAGRNLFSVAGSADIVVAGRGSGHLAGACETVVAALAGIDGVATYIAFGAEGEGFEGADVHYAGTCEDGC